MSISINDVARVAGVSKSTVSRVLGGGPVSEDVRGRVELAIRQTGYRPNLQARRLRSRHTGIIGLIVADIRNPFFTADRKSTRLNSSHSQISYAVFCLKKKKKTKIHTD